MISPADIKKLIREAGQRLTLETRAVGDRLTLNVEYGYTSQPATSTKKLHGYVYSPSVKERPIIGATFLEGDAMAVISAVGVSKEAFTPGCILIADGRRYVVAYAGETKHQTTVLFHRLQLTPEDKTQ